MSYCIESYLALKNVNQKKNITKLITSSHNLMIEKGRYLNLNREERLCPFCPNRIIEDEIHFLFICLLYKHLRNDFFTYMSIQCQLELIHLSITQQNNSKIHFLLGTFVSKCFEYVMKN